jgi:hypothetical protein
MQSFYTNNVFLAGVILMKDDEFKYTCSNSLPLLIGNEYVKSVSDEELEAIELLYEQLGITDIRTYPTPSYLDQRVFELFPDFYGRMSFMVVVPGEEEVGTLSGDPGSTVCTFPIHGLGTGGTVWMEMDTRGLI